MTTKEAIKGLKTIRTVHNGNYAEHIDYAIKALEQQLCEDCVKREDVKSGMIKYGFLAPDMTVTEFVADLPFVTPKAEWIPVSERLPESDEEYHTFWVTDSKGRVTLSEFCLSISDKKPYWSGMVDVIAWMPLPEPYNIPKQTFGCAED